MKSSEPINSYVERLVREADVDRGKYEGAWQKNHNRYLGEHWDTEAPAGLKHFTINRTQTAILATVAVQTQSRPRIKLEPVDTNDEPIYFIREDAIARIGLPIDPLAPLDRMQLDQLIQATMVEVEVPQQEPAPGGEEGGAPAPPMTELQPQLSEDDIIVVDDAAVADAMETVLEVMWDRMGADYLWVESILNKSIYGHQPMLIQWDDEKLIPVASNEHQKNVWIDPLATGIEDAEYLIFDQVFSAQEAKRAMPEHAAVIDREKDTGSVTPINETSGSLGSPYTDNFFEREMVTLRTCWLKNQTFPLSEEEAIESGEVQPAMDLVSMPDPATGQEMLSPVEVPGMYILVESTEPTAPDAPNWPTRSGIRQIQIIGETTVSDEESPYEYIPWAWNVNVPIPHSPYGQGEPQRLWDVQEAINRLASIFHNHVKKYQSPEEVMPASMAEANEANGRPMHSFAGGIRIMPDDLLMQFPGVKWQIDVPSLPSGYFAYFDRMNELLDELSGNTEALQGRAPGRVESGRAIEALQTAAVGTIGFKSIYTERAVQQFVRILLGMIRDFLPEDRFVKIAGEHPPHVLMLVRDRAKSLEWDIRVEVVSGKGTSRRQEEDKAIQLRQMGDMDRLSLLQKLEMPDAEQIAAAREAEEQRMAMTQPV